MTTTISPATTPLAVCNCARPGCPGTFVRTDARRQYATLACQHYVKSLRRSKSPRVLYEPKKLEGDYFCLSCQRYTEHADGFCCACGRERCRA